MEPNGNIFMIMQRWHEDDLTSYLIEQGFEYIRLPAIAEEKDPLGRKPGEALWPERFPLEDLLAIRDGKKNPDGSFAKGIPDYFWQAMYQGNPRPMKGRVIDAAWFKRWTSLPENPNEHAIFADFNIKEEKNVKVEGEKNDFTVFEYWVRKGSSCYLVDQVRGVWGITDQVDQFLRFMRKWPRAIGKYLENKANAPAAQNMLKNRIGGIILVEPQGGKIARAMACEPIFKAGNVYIPSDEERNPWIKKYLDEFSGFPGGKHDDQVDTTTLALLHFDQAIPGNLTALINGWKH
jgi:predicted phage terminase large subunit-like protein